MTEARFSIITYEGDVDTITMDNSSPSLRKMHAEMLRVFADALLEEPVMVTSHADGKLTPYPTTQHHKQ